MAAPPLFVRGAACTLGAEAAKPPSPEGDTRGRTFLAALSQEDGERMRVRILLVGDGAEAQAYEASFGRDALDKDLAERHVEPKDSFRMLRRALDGGETDTDSVRFVCPEEGEPYLEAIYAVKNVSIPVRVPPRTQTLTRAACTAALASSIFADVTRFAPKPDTPARSKAVPSAPPTTSLGPRDSTAANEQPAQATPSSPTEPIRSKQQRRQQKFLKELTSRKRALKR